MPKRRMTRSQQKAMFAKNKKGVIRCIPPMKSNISYKNLVKFENEIEDLILKSKSRRYIKTMPTKFREDLIKIYIKNKERRS